MDILFLVIGLLLGAIIGFLLGKTKGNVSTNDDTLFSEKDKLTQLESQLIQLQNEKLSMSVLNGELAKEKEMLSARNSQIEFELKEYRAMLSSEKEINAALRTKQLNLEELLDKQKTELTEVQEKFTKEFELIANKVLEQKSQAFKEQNKESIGELLNPLKERIKEFQEKVEKTNEEGLQRNTALTEQIKQLKELNQEITDETKSLTKALRGDSKTQGNWGELQLEAILEKAGLEKGVHYQKESNLKTEDGSNQRLDYIINMPDGKHLILDSKVSLTAYSNYFDTDDENERAKYLKQHLDSLNMHIKTLSEKDYHKLYGINPPDYVLMFIANEPALTIALKEDSNLYEKALSKNLVLVSTTTLLATLRTISYIWKQDLQNKNAEEIARQAANMYDKFVGFTNDILKLGAQLKTVTSTYEDAAKKLTEGKGNLVKRAEDLKKLGVNPSNNIDQRLIERSEDS
ncbi:MAG: DNA recombination protein RmuC [Flavobacteriales bacterium]|nr:DNA recombination protein RmuC [Flavobacteriales bacterium]